jgi:ribosome-binding factor A
MQYRKNRIAQLLKETAAHFFREASDKTSMITVTNADVSPDLASATVYISVYPDEQQDKALSFARGATRRLKEYIKKHTALARVPSVSVAIDEGELNRRRIEEISHDLHTPKDEKDT